MKAAKHGGVSVDVAIDARADLGEGPVWDTERQELHWVDVTRNLIHSYRPSGGAVRARDVGQPVGAVAPRARQEGLIAAVRDGFAVVDEQGRCVFVARPEADNPLTRMNDGKVDPSGRFWAGTMAFDERPGAGSLYRLEPSGRVERVLTGLSISNGMDWTEDRSRMFFIDSPTQRVDMFDFDDATGAIRRRRTFCEVTGDGVPDGMTVDADGGVWVAVWGGSCVRRYSPSGALVESIEVPASQVTSCAFGGSDLRDLYITSAAGGLTTEQRLHEPHAGALFVCRPDANGRPSNRFAA